MLIRFLCAIACALNLCACEMHPITIQYTARSSLNKNMLGQSTPVAVKVIQLNQKEAIENEDIKSIWQQYVDEHVRKIYLDPGSKDTIHWKRLDGMHYLMIVADFRSCGMTGCKLIVPMGRSIPFINKKFKFNLVNNYIKEVK